MNDRRGESVSKETSEGEGPGSGPILHEDVQELVRRTLAGDDDAFAEVFRRFRDKVYRICFRFSGDHDEAMDLLQTTFIKVHRSLASYRRESSFATWISRVATNTGLDHVRARKREARADLDETVAEAGVPGSERVSAARPAGPGEALQAAELGEAIRRAVDDLSEKHRSVFVLHCVDGMPYREIAETLQISIGTVMSRLFHARRYLRRSLAPYLGEARVRTLLDEPRGGDEETTPAPARGGGKR